MLYLYEHQLGYHTVALGYPSIDSCNAICLQTTSGLFGIHVYGCDTFHHIGDTENQMEKEARAFASFVNGHPNKTEFVHLYSACFYGKRGLQGAGKKGGRKEEVEVYANALGYTGEISSFNLSSLPNWPTREGSQGTDSAYVEFRRLFEDVTLLVKPWSQCQYSDETKPGPPIADGVNYRSTNQKGEVTDTFWFKKMITWLNTNKTGFIIAPRQLRTTFKH